MAFERKNVKTNQEDAENIYGFSRSVKGYNAKEVNEFISNLMKNNSNAIKNYESRISEFKDNNEILSCEIEQLKEASNKHQQNAKSAIAAADETRAKLKAIQKDIDQVQSIKEENERLNRLVESLTSERDIAKRDAMRAEVDKKHAKEKLDGVKKELSETKKALAEALESAQNAPAPEKESEKKEAPASVQNPDAELEKMVGAYTVHLRKTRQIVDSLVEQLNKANDIF